MAWSHRSSVRGLALAASLGLATWSGVASPMDARPARSPGRVVPLREAVDTVARELGLLVHGDEHLTGLVESPTGLIDHQTLERLLSGYSFAIVLDDAHSGRLLILGGAGTGSGAIPGDRPAPGRGPARPFWGFADLASLAGTIPDDEIQVLAEASQSSDLDARLTAVSGLAQYGSAVAGVLGAAAQDADPSVRLTAVQHLAAAGAAAAPHLVRAFNEVRDPSVRALALSALAASDPAAARHLATTALHDPDPAVRAAAEDIARTGSGSSPPAR